MHQPANRGAPEQGGGTDGAPPRAGVQRGGGGGAGGGVRAGGGAAVRGTAEPAAWHCGDPAVHGGPGRARL